MVKIDAFKVRMNVSPLDFPNFDGDIVISFSQVCLSKPQEPPGKVVLIAVIIYLITQ